MRPYFLFRGRAGLFISYPHLYYLLLCTTYMKKVHIRTRFFVHHFIEGSESKGALASNLTVYLKEKLQYGCANSKGRRLVIHPGSWYT